ncbi:MAG TPA: histidine phosphatase family protein [Gaiellaceae bacterium]|jgi:broad specificity phosphatase PhoE|nr:histidine phosphatase family protein [Gaiellaceae bacterium]
MEQLILARHGESEYSLRGLVNGEPGAGVALTGRGKEEARRLGRELAGEPLDLALHTGFPRTRATLELVLAGRDDVVVLAEPRLADPRAGEFEGRTLDEYRAWARNEGSRSDAPGGGESRLAVAARYAAAYRALLERRERTILAVLHALPIAYLLLARDGEPPRPRVDLHVEHARPYPLGRRELQCALGVLERWCASPTW